MIKLDNQIRLTSQEKNRLEDVSGYVLETITSIDELHDWIEAVKRDLSEQGAEREGLCSNLDNAVMDILCPTGRVVLRDIDKARLRVSTCGLEPTRIKTKNDLADYASAAKSRFPECEKRDLACWMVDRSVLQALAG